jgi:hypothetical protein
MPTTEWSNIQQHAGVVNAGGQAMLMVPDHLVKSLHSLSRFDDIRFCGERFSQQTFKLSFVTCHMDKAECQAS